MYRRQGKEVGLAKRVYFYTVYLWRLVEGVVVYLTIYRGSVIIIVVVTMVVVIVLVVVVVIPVVIIVVVIPVAVVVVAIVAWIIAVTIIAVIIAIVVPIIVIVVKTAVPSLYRLSINICRAPTILGHMS